jgi:hypothetical protein
MISKPANGNTNQAPMWKNPKATTSAIPANAANNLTLPSTDNELFGLAIILSPKFATAINSL